MAGDDLFKRYLEIGASVLGMSRERAESIVRDLVASGEVARGQATKAADWLVERGRTGTEELAEMVRREIRQQVTALGLATKEDLARLEERIDELKASTPPDKAGTPPDKAGTPPDKAGTPPDKAGTPPDKAGTRPAKASRTTKGGAAKAAAPAKAASGADTSAGISRSASVRKRARPSNAAAPGDAPPAGGAVPPKG